MKTNDDLLRQIESDLSLHAPYVKGKNNQIRNCWHFYTDGNVVDSMFNNDQDFIDGMNRVYAVWKRHRIVILAFCLMDTHLHFILYGDFDKCNSFMHEYTKITSRHISIKYNDKQKLCRLPINYQQIDNDYYLKTAIAYVIKNPPVAGIGFCPWDYPWGTGSMYFRKRGYWTLSHSHKDITTKLSDMTYRERRKLLKSDIADNADDLCVEVFCGIVSPFEYVSWEIVEKIFRSHRAFNYFMCITKEEDIESKGGSISRLSIPIQEMRQLRDDLCKELFGVATIRSLDTNNRLKLAKTLRANYNCSLKQIARLCGLVHNELNGIIR